jgi:hypothetical protein
MIGREQLQHKPSASRTYPRCVLHPDNAASRADPARRRRKLPPAPANSRKTRAGKPWPRREFPPIPAQAGSAKTDLSRRRSRVRVPSLPSLEAPASAVTARAAAASRRSWRRNKASERMTSEGSTGFVPMTSIQRDHGTRSRRLRCRGRHGAEPTEPQRGRHPAAVEISAARAARALQRGRTARRAREASVSGSSRPSAKATSASRRTPVRGATRSRPTQWPSP